jgi:putative copper export protein
MTIDDGSLSMVYRRSMDALIKASLYIGTILLVGAGVYTFLVARPNPAPKRLRWLLLSGFVLVVMASVFNLMFTVMKALGSRFNTAFLWEYATSTRHGTMTFFRLALALALVLLTLFVRWRNVQTFLFCAVGLGFLFTYSGLSHPASMGKMPLVADYLHITAASLWAGAVIYCAILPMWSSPQLGIMIRRVSSLGFISVCLLLATGTYIIVVHLGLTKATLFSSVYERVLAVKLGLVLVILALSAINRWYFVPRLEGNTRGFRRTLLTEAILLFTVLATTGLLTVSPLPHN